MRTFTILLLLFLSFSASSYAQAGVEDGDYYQAIEEYEPDRRDELRLLLRQEELRRMGAPADLSDEDVEPPAEPTYVANLPHRSKLVPRRRAPIDWMWMGSEGFWGDFVDLGPDGRGQHLFRWGWKDDYYRPFWNWSPPKDTPYTAVLEAEDEKGDWRALVLTEFVMPTTYDFNLSYDFSLPQESLKNIKLDDANVCFMQCNMRVAEQLLWNDVLMPGYVKEPKRDRGLWEVNNRIPSTFSCYDIYLEKVKPAGQDRWDWSAVLPFEYDSHSQDGDEWGNTVMLYDAEGWIVGRSVYPKCKPGPYPGSTTVYGTLRSKQKPVDIEIFTPFNVAGG